ncbi:MAG TPA: hypothetical protein VJQ09_05520 [Candidatus Limnocylindria bacterium]|nr:hypothetical protein [Candidatus Limnocylindria bacterium]
MPADDPVMAKRAALVAICERAANGVVDRVVGEASNGASAFGLSGDGARHYGDGIRSTLPLAFEALGMPDGPEREARIRALAGSIRAVSERNHIPRIVERGLTAIAVRISREVIRRQSADRGFTPDELDREFTRFTDEMEMRLFGETA